MKRWKAWMLLVILILLFASCNTDRLFFFAKDNEPDSGLECPIRIGIITSVTDQSGKEAVGGREHLMGYRMALDEINAAGGILGCPVELIVEDDVSNASRAAQLVKKLTDDDQVPVIAGAYSSDATLPAAGVANAYKVPFLVPTASADLITKQGYKWVFRINATSSDYANAALDFVQKLGAQGISIIYDESLFGESAAVEAATAAQERWIDIWDYEAYIPGTVDFAKLVEWIKLSNADVLYFASGSVKDAVQLLKQCRDLDVNPKLYVGQAGGFVTREFVQGASKNAEFMIATAQWAVDMNWPGVPEFTLKFTDLYGSEPTMRSAQTYVTLYVIKEAMELAERDRLQKVAEGAEDAWTWDDIHAVRLALRDALQKLDMPNTIFGPINFDPDTGQNKHDVLLVQILDGHFVTVYPEKYRSREPVFPTPRWSERE